MMTLRLNQLVYTSFQNSGLQLLTSSRVSADMQSVFMEEIVDQYWDPCNPYEAQYQAAYVHQATPQDYFFGWVYNEEAEQGYVPLFLCYHLEGALTTPLLDAVFVCLQQGPVQQIRPQDPPPQLVTLELETLEVSRAVRPGVSVPQDIQQESYAAIEQNESLSLFVPSLGTTHAVPLSPMAQPVEEMKPLPALDRSRLIRAGAVVGGLMATLLGLSVYQFRPSASIVTLTPTQEDSTQPAPASLPSSSQAVPNASQPRFGPAGQPQTTGQPSPSQNRQDQSALADALRRASRRQSILQNAKRQGQSIPVDQRIALSKRQSVGRSSPRSTGSTTVSVADLERLLPQRRLRLPRSAVQFAQLNSPQPVPPAVRPALPPEPAPKALRPEPPAPVVTLPSSPALLAAQPDSGTDEEASRLAEIATSQKLANVLTRGLVVANRAGDVTYRSATYLQVQNVIRRLRLGEEWSTAANQSGVSEQLIVDLAQLAYDADLDAVSIAINKGVTTHDIANAIARGLVIADREGEVRYRSHTYLKVQDVIHRLRLGQNRHFAARQSGVQQALIEKLLVLGGLPPAAGTVSFSPVGPFKPIG